MTQNDQELKEKIIQYMERSTENRYYVKDISDIVGHISSDEFKEVVKALAAIERYRRVLLTKDGQFKILEPEPTFVGKFSWTERGFGFVTRPDFEKDIYIHQNDVNTALNRDHVRGELTKPAQPWQRRAADSRRHRS